MAMKRDKTSLKNDKNKFTVAGDRQQAGTKWSRYGQRSDTIGSVLDQERVKKNLEERKLNYGEGAVKVGFFDAGGTIMKGAPVNIDGRVHYTDANGHIVHVDGSKLEEMEMEKRERMEYVRNLVKLALVSNDAFAMLLSVDVADIVQICAPGGANSYFGSAIMSDDVDNTNCEPDLLDTIDGNSIHYSMGINKIRKVIEFVMPVVKNMTSKEVGNKGVE